MKILFTGSRGFIAGYTIQKLLDEGHTVIGVDNNSKYGVVEKSYDNNKNFKQITGDAKDSKLLTELLVDNEIDIFVMGAAVIGGITMFHTLAYDLLAENERITASSFDAAIKAKQNSVLDHIISVSSSMIYESAIAWPSVEDSEKIIPPPMSTYGFQKLATHYFCKGAWEQYKLPYKMVIPFNAVGIGEQRALVETEIVSGNIKLAMSHVVPDIIQKIHKNQYPLKILGNGNQVRHYTYAGDLAEGIYKVIFNDNAMFNSFNLSTDKGHTVLELAKIIWNMMNKDKEFMYESETPFTYDVQNRVPDTTKAKNMLNFEANTSLETALEEIIPWVTKMCDLGKI